MFRVRMVFVTIANATKMKRMMIDTIATTIATKNLFAECVAVMTPKKYTQLDATCVVHIGGDVIQEMDINPLVVYPKGGGVKVVDALIRK